MLARSGLFLAFALGCSLATSLACKREPTREPAEGGNPAPAEGSAGEGAADEPAELEAIDRPEAEYVGRELPAELQGELHEAGGRIVVLAPGFVAVSPCVDCGAPTYLMFMAVRCSAPRACEVLTESCQGSIVASEQEFTLAFTPVEGADAKVCESYSGSFAAQ